MRRKKSGFTIVEVLVVIAIIGVLAAILLPAVQAAREAARRITCLNNLRGLATALQNYHDVNGTFPASSLWWDSVHVKMRNNPDLRENWVITILPFIDEQATYDAFDLSRPIPASVNATARGARIEAMLCPSDPYNARPFNGSGSTMTDKMGDGWGRGNYAANASLDFMQFSPQENGWLNDRMRGVMGINVGLSFKQMTDGPGKTVLLGEIRAGVTDFDSRGVWAMSGACPSSLWAHGFHGDDNGPNNAFPHADDVMACTDIKAAVGGEGMLAAMGMACSSGNFQNFQQTMRSTHVGGVTACMADGSARWISDFVDVVGSGQGDSVWERIHASADGLLPPGPREF